MSDAGIFDVSPQRPSLTDMLDLVIGEYVLVIPSHLPGQQFDGTLVAILGDSLGLPEVVQIKQDDREIFNIPWNTISLITRWKPPAQTPIDPQDVADLVKAQGGEIPSNVQEFLDSQEGI